MSNGLDKYGFNNVMRWIVGIIGAGIVVYALWYFRFIVLCIFIALILSIVGRPIMNLLGKIKIWHYELNGTLRAAITLCVEIGIMGLIIYFLVPLIISQAQNFSSINVNSISLYYSEPIRHLDSLVQKYNLMPEDTSLETYLSTKIMEILSSIKLPQIAAVMLSLTGKIIMGILITAFITFFFLKDSHIVTRFIDNITPDEYLDEIHNIINHSRKLLTRYFVGLFIEILTMSALLSIGFSLAGFENAILIAVIGGVMVILPYIGVVIGGGIGLMILITQTLFQNPNADVTSIIITFVIIFVIVKLIDDFLLQPFIYSKSVKAHPLEIFLVILMAGEVGGIIGMIVAIPAYTFLRIIAKEFFSKWKFIKALTKQI